MKNCNLIKGVVIGEINIRLIYAVVIRLRKITEEMENHSFFKKREKGDIKNIEKRKQDIFASFWYLNYGNCFQLNFIDLRQSL